MIILFSSNQKLTLAQQQLQTDYEKVKSEESEKSHKLQELMSVDNSDYTFSLPPDNKIQYETSKTQYPSSFTRPKSPSWEEFIPYKDEINSKNSAPKCNPKLTKDALNNLKKMSKSQCTMSVFHIHTLHLHLFISLTLLLVTHRCPQYLVVF